MSQPTPPVNPPMPPGYDEIKPAGNFANPAFLLALVPTVDFILTTFFHHDFGLSKNAQQWAVIASGVVGFGAYVARAVKHHANAQVLAAWFTYLASQTGTQVTTQTSSDGNTQQVTTTPVTTVPTPEPVAPPQPVDPAGDSGGTPTDYTGEGGNLEGLRPENTPRRAISTTRSAQKRTAGKKTTSARGR